MVSTTLCAAFLEQSRACRELGSPFMGRLMAMLADHWPDDTALARRFAAWSGDVSNNSQNLPLRLAGGLHALVLSGQDAELASAYPLHDPGDAALLAAVQRAMRRHDGYLCAWAESPPQTNEVRRSAVLIAAAHVLAARYGLPIQLSELGASAGLNLMFDRFALQIGDTLWGPDDATVRLMPKWRGTPPPLAKLTISERRGVDLNPLRVGKPEDVLRLMSYIWPDQQDRMERTRAAIALFDAEIDKGDAIDWLAKRLAKPWSGSIHLVYHTIAWQYFPREKQEAGRTLIETAGAAATEDAPLAWFSMEGDPDANRAILTLRLWPGDIRLPLGYAGFHGQWVEWLGA
jgi:hypothetical protein